MLALVEALQKKRQLIDKSPVRKRQPNSIRFVTPALRESLFGTAAEEAPNGNGTIGAIPKESSADEVHLQAGAELLSGSTDEQPSKKRRRKQSLPEGPAFEESRESMGLRLLGDRGAAGAKVMWTYPLMDERRRCFAGYLPRALQPQVAQKLLEAAQESTEWLQPEGRFGPIPRKTAWMVKSPCSCKYSYGGLRIAPTPFAAWVLDAMKLCMPLCGLSDPSEWPDSCNLNLYENGMHAVAWHADDEDLFQGKLEDCAVISLSLGQTRRFDLKAITEPSESCNLRLASGDLCTMEGMLQKHYVHRVPHDRNGVDDGPRVNLTWRWVKKHNRSCSESPNHHQSADESESEGTQQGGLGGKKIGADLQVDRPTSGCKKKQLTNEIKKLLQQTTPEVAGGSSSLSVDALLATAAVSAMKVSAQDVELVASVPSARLQLERRADGLFVRSVASRAHRRGDCNIPGRRLSPTDLDLPRTCVHGTTVKALPRVLERGFVAGKKSVHFSIDDLDISADPATGMGGSSTIAVYLDLKRALQDGMDIDLSVDETSLLTKGFDGAVPSKYFFKAVDISSAKVVWTAEEASAHEANTVRAPDVEEKIAASPQTSVEESALV